MKIFHSRVSFSPIQLSLRKRNAFISIPLEVFFCDVFCIVYQCVYGHFVWRSMRVFFCWDCNNEEEIYPDLIQTLYYRRCTVKIFLIFLTRRLKLNTRQVWGMGLFQHCYGCNLHPCKRSWRWYTIQCSEKNLLKKEKNKPSCTHI